MCGEELRASQSEEEAFQFAPARATRLEQSPLPVPCEFCCSHHFIDISQLNPLGFHPEKVRRGGVRRWGTG